MANNSIPVKFRCGHVEYKEVSRTALQQKLLSQWNTSLCTACSNAKEDIRYPADKYDLVTMHYSEYKERYKGYCHARTGSYDPSTKHIQVYVPK